MRIIIPIAVLTALNVWAQAPATTGTPAKQPGLQVHVEQPPITSLAPTTLIATVDGRKITAGELQAVLHQLPPQVQQQAQQDRPRFISQYGVLLKLADEARKAKLEEQSPYKEAIAYNTMQILYQAEVSQKLNTMAVPEEAIKKEYDGNKEKYTQAKVKGIYLPFSTAPVSQTDAKGKKILSETEAKTQAEDLVKQLHAGGDFVKFVKQYSGDAKSAEKDGDFGTIHNGDQNIPADLKKAIFAAKAGEVTAPVRQANGYYIFRVEEIGTQPYSEVQAKISNDLKNQQFGEWLNSLEKGLDIKWADPQVAVQPLPAPSSSPSPAAK